MYSGGGEIIVAPPTMQQHMGSAIMLIVLLAAGRDTVSAQTEMRVIRVCRHSAGELLQPPRAQKSLGKEAFTPGTPGAPGITRPTVVEWATEGLLLLWAFWGLWGPLGPWQGHITSLWDPC
ncbi:hypothetical protein INS49_011022 [Diaporthe citri]|uniref:uncharacterized protein n=1 Tax=Diaporthe citri TaxID=83186 RepID=UPI001C80AFB7|nr:uncharacterized protein INS49_011022 [Diaporthe citri]KAG6359968.1 hypothetical protein INS49_011022 [Diaporthe citri]